MKILLLSPPTNIEVFWQAGSKKKGEQRTPPLGLGYIASILEHAGYDVNLIDMFNTSFEEGERIIRQEKPDIVGISCFTEFRIGSLKLAKLVKAVNPNIKVIMGGSHAAIMYEQVLRNYPVDYIVMGEGEITMLELVNALGNNTPAESIKGIAFMKNGQVMKTERRPPILDLDTIPFPAHHFFDIDAYEPENFRLPRKFVLKDDTNMTGKLRKTSIITSRGCPFKCQYCSTSLFWGHKWRSRSAKNVLDELEMLYIDYGIRYFVFVDDAFTADHSRAIDICKGILERGLDICWTCCTRTNYISAELLEWLAKAGCFMISYGIESGSSAILKTIHKHQSIEQIIQAFNMTHDAGITTTMLLMVGNPGESDTTIKETMDLIKRADPTFISVAITQIYPGTELYEIAKEKGFIDDDYWLNLSLTAPIYTLENRVEKLKTWQDKINNFFARNKLYSGIRERDILKIAAYVRYEKNRVLNLFKS